MIDTAVRTRLYYTIVSSLMTLPQRRNEGILDEHGKLKPVDGEPFKKSRKKRTAVLGRDTIAEIRRDMHEITLPSWFTRAPSHPGERKWGKFTADQWRAFCMVNLPITLIRLWGSKPKDSREHKMLINFMHLVTAVKLGTMRKVTGTSIAAYELHMHKYLTGVLKLYPHTEISPYQHLALHFGTMLQRFGPTHTWRCFPFERYNYLLQKIPTNSKFGMLNSILTDFLAYLYPYSSR